MLTLFIILGLSFVASLVLTPVARVLATRFGLVDHPDGRRKMHAQGTPVAGGLALLLAASLAVLIAFVTAIPPVGEELRAEGGSLLSLFLAALVICLVGVVDDFIGLRGRHKLLGQIVAVSIVMSSGLIVRNLGFFDWHIELGLLAVPFTLFWLLGAINSLNLIDGMDGLLSTVGLIISLAMAAMAIIGGHWMAACVAVALAGGLLGFLRYNLPPASIFLGDSGSMLIGLVVGTLAIKSSLKSPATVALAAPLAVLTIPIFDTFAAIIRRKLTGRSIYATDRGHLHHCLLRRGFSSRRVLICISCFCLLSVFGALASLALRNELVAILAAVVVIAIMVTTRLFGYAEFVLIKERLAALAVSFLHRGTNGKAHQLEVRLQGSHGWQELWNALTICAEQLELQTLQMDVNAPARHESYHARWDRLGELAEETQQWRAEIPLIVLGETVGRLDIAGQQNAEPIWMQIATVAKLMQEFEIGVPQPEEPSSDVLEVPVNGSGRMIQPERV